MTDDDDKLFYRELHRIKKEEGQERRAHNRESSARLLASRNIHFEVKNHGAHLIVHGRDQLIDFWPGTGKWITRQTKETGRGVMKMHKHHIRKEKPECKEER